MDPMLALALPIGAVAFGLMGLVINKLSIRRFELKYPHLTRQGMRVIERERALRRLPSMPAPLGAWTARKPTQEEIDRAYAEAEHRYELKRAERLREDQNAA